MADAANPFAALPPDQLRQLALFLDVDGTLLDIAPLPDAVRVPAELRESLGQLYDALGGAIAIISGRSISQIDQLFKPLRLPASGEHGFEMRRDPAGAIERLESPAVLKLLRPAMIDVAKKMPGVLPEFKGSTIALHYRQVPSRGPELRKLIDVIIAPYEEQIAVQTGKMVFEVKPAGVDKGRAIDRLMMAPPFQGRFPIFAGDDDTDEHGFATVRQLGGLALRVGTPGSTPVDMVLESPSAVRAWLRDLVTMLAPRVA